jgi:hypothetical protein
MLLTPAIVLAGVTSVLALPRPEAADKNSPPNQYTLSAYAPKDSKINGLKAELNSDLWLYQEKVISYCPLPSGCPNGNHTAFGAGMYPVWDPNTIVAEVILVNQIKGFRSTRWPKLLHHRRGRISSDRPAFP